MDTMRMSDGGSVGGVPDYAYSPLFTSGLHPSHLDETSPSSSRRSNSKTTTTHGSRRVDVVRGGATAAHGEEDTRDASRCRSVMKDVGNTASPLRRRDDHRQQHQHHNSPSQHNHHRGPRHPNQIEPARQGKRSKMEMTGVKATALPGLVSRGDSCDGGAGSFHQTPPRSSHPSSPRHLDGAVGVLGRDEEWEGWETGVWMTAIGRDTPERADTGIK